MPNPKTKTPGLMAFNPKPLITVEKGKLLSLYLEYQQRLNY